MPNGQLLQQYPETPATTGGIGSKQLLLLDAVPGNSPGWWAPWAPFHNGSFEVTQTGAPLGNWTVYTSNAAQMPANGYTITVGGTAHAGDVCSINLLGPDFVNGLVSASYTVQSGDSTSTIAAALVVALQAAIKQQEQIGFTQLTANVVSQIQVSAAGAIITVLTQSPLVTYFDCAASVIGPSATTTLAVAPLDTTTAGFATGPSLTAAGNVPINIVATWIKANSIFSSGAGTVTAIVQAVIP